MSNNFDDDPIRYGSAGNVAVDAGLRTFFRSVYNYMIAGPYKKTIFEKLF